MIKLITSLMVVLIFPAAGFAAPANKPMDAAPVQWDGPAFENPANRFVLSDWGEANPAVLTDMGKLNGFYSYTQLQGHLVQDGLNLYKVPDFWCTGSDFPYRKKGGEREVFFVDEFSITRFLGGYPQNWKHNDRQLKSNDMAFTNENGEVQYRLNLVKERLQPYLDNGYRKFIIGIENIWDLSRDPSKFGPYGPTEPPRDWNEWQTFVKAVCEEMKRVYPADVQLKFKIGNEYNQKKSFTGTHEDFLKLYDYSAAAILTVFPEAEIMPGEIGGGASGTDNAVDYPKLYDHFVNGTNYAGLPQPSPVSVLTRSSHSFPFKKDLSPKERVQFSVDSLKEVLTGKPQAFADGLSLEYHQFGVLGTRFSESAYPVDARTASWQFQVLFRSKASGYMDKCWSWDKAEQVTFSNTVETHFLNGLGWLYMILEHVQGDRVCLPGIFQPAASEDDATAVVFANDRRVVLMLASWSRDPDSVRNIPVRVSLPHSILPFELDLKQARMVSFTDAENVYSEIRQDLEKADNLLPIFANNPDALGTIKNMAADYPKARQMIDQGLEKYQKIQQQSLTLKPVPAGSLELSSVPRVPQQSLSAVLLPNEVRVFVFMPPNFL
jgi:hypothetical protein